MVSHFQHLVSASVLATISNSVMPVIKLSGQNSWVGLKKNAPSINAQTSSSFSMSINGGGLSKDQTHLCNIMIQSIRGN